MLLKPGVAPILASGRRQQWEPPQGKPHPRFSRLGLEGQGTWEGGEAKDGGRRERKGKVGVLRGSHLPGRYADPYANPQSLLLAPEAQGLLTGDP